MEDVQVEPDSLKIGLEVQFKSNPERKAVEITPVGQASPKVTSQYAKAQPKPQDGFVNPYNFVPLGEKEPKREKPESHEYFIGKSGQITCKLTLNTPFFTPHPERRFQLPQNAERLDDDKLPDWVRKEVSAKQAWEELKHKIAEFGPKVEKYSSKGHEMLGLLKDEWGKPFIPGSLLKGAFRAVAEALSNSCLSITDFGLEIKDSSDIVTLIEKSANFYSYRHGQSPDGIGRVKRLATKDQEGEIEVATNSMRVLFKSPNHVIQDEETVREVCENLSRFKDGEEVLADVTTLDYERRGSFLVAKDLGSGAQRGILKISDTPPMKNSQLFVVFGGNSYPVKFGWTQQLAYNRANQVGINQDKSQPEFIQLGKAGQRRRRHSLQIGDIVHFTQSNNRVDDMGTVGLYRVLYQKSLDQILVEKHRKFLTCDKSHELCPSCRIFGWVHPNPKEEDIDIAQKGFIHFSTATTNQAPQTKWVTLKPLGKPSPSSWQFYLWNPATPDKPASFGYNPGDISRRAAQQYNPSDKDYAEIRGRKFYWHQPDAEENSVADWRKTEQKTPHPPDDQNKTVELLPLETTFTFTVDFENLSDEDLGLLLLTLQPNLLGEGIPSDRLYHHFGMGKPLGLGSAEVKIAKLTLINRAKRYQSLSDNGEILCNQNAMIDAFVRKVLGRQAPSSDSRANRRTFANLKHIEALLIMLDWKNTPKPVKYPPGDSDANSKQYWESFNWFSKQRDPHNKELLHTPQKIKDGDRQRQPTPPRQNQGSSRRGGRYRQRGRRG